MKKSEYIAPRIEVVKIEGCAIMAGSEITRGDSNNIPDPDIEDDGNYWYWGD